MKEKIKFIFIPAFLTLFGLIIGYTFLNWILFIKLELFGLKDIVTNFGIPAVLAGGAAWFFLRRRFKILHLEAKRGNWVDFYSFILWIVLAAPTIVAQEYISTASGKLAELNSVRQIKTAEPSKFYTFRKFYLNKKSAGIHSSFDASGRYNEDLNMHIYVAVPIVESESDTSELTCPAWYGIEYRETISNRLDQSEKEKKFREFAERSQSQFDRDDLLEFAYLDRISNSDKKEGLAEAIKTTNYNSNSDIILVPVKETFEARNGSKLEWIFLSSLIGLSVWLLMIMIPRLNEYQLTRIKKGKPDKDAQQEMKDLLYLLKPRDGFFVTPVLIYLNIAVFVLMMLFGLGFISFKGQDLLALGANYGPLTKGGEWWRLLTSTFLHGGLMHVLANMYGLFFVGIFLEPILGKGRFVVVYLVTGVVASLASIWWYQATVSVGASGAIFGLYGLFLSFILTKVFAVEFGKAFLLSTLIFVGYNLLIGLIGGVDNAAHIGGLVSGLVFGLILSPVIKKEVLEDNAGYDRQ